MRKWILTLLIAAIALLGVLPISAQDTETPTEEPTEEISSEEATPEETTSEETTSEETTDELEMTEDGATIFDELAVPLPEGWGGIIDTEGYVLIADFDVATVISEAEESGESPAIPEGPLVLRMIMTSIPNLGADDDLSAGDLLQLFTNAPAEGPQIEELEEDGVSFAQIIASDDESGVYIMGRYLADDLYLLASLVGPLEKVEAELETAQGVFLMAEPALEPMITDDALTDLYASIPQSTTEEGFPILGDPEAGAEVMEIGSFSCPACKLFHDEVFPGVLERIEAGEVVFTYVPIASTGNVPNGVYAAEVALCAGEQGQFWPMFDALYDAQAFGATAFISSRIDPAIEALGLDAEAFEACLEEGNAGEIVDTAEEYARSVPGFTGTPSILVNGDILEGFAPIIINEAIDAALGIAPAETEEVEDSEDMDATEEVSEEPTDDTDDSSDDTSEDTDDTAEEDGESE